MTQAKYLPRFIIICFWILTIFLSIFIYNIISSASGKKSINVLCWAGMFDLQYISRFEKQTGIKVKFSYFETNDELLVKLKATHGRGYDLIVPGDYAVDLLIKEGALQKIDKSKIKTYKNLNPALLGHYFDVENKYSIPAAWAVFGLGIDKRYFGSRLVNPSWSLIFDKKYMPKKIVMINDPLIAMAMAGIYLFGSLENLTQEKLSEIKKLLIAQKKHVEAYTEFRPDYFMVTKNAAIVASGSDYIWRGMIKYPYIEFLIPKEGSLLTIENFAIPKTSSKTDLVYQFIDFFLEPNVVKHHFEEFAIFPSTTDALKLISKDLPIYNLLTISKDQLSKFSFIKLDELKKHVDEKFLKNLWVEVKA